MKPRLAPPFQRCERAFTLVEVMVVMAIIALMAGIGVAAFRGSPNNDVKAGSALVASVFSEARNLAIMKRKPVRVIVDTAYDSSRPQNYLRRLTVAYQTDPNGGAADWVQASRWVQLPGNAYFNPNYSNPPGDKTMAVNFAGGGAPTSGYSYYEFTPNGQALQSATGTGLTQCIVSHGSVDSWGAFAERGDKGNLYGFALFRLGRPQFFENIDDIQKQ